MEAGLCGQALQGEGRGTDGRWQRHWSGKQLVPRDPVFLLPWVPTASAVLSHKLATVCPRVLLSHFKSEDWHSHSALWPSLLSLETTLLSRTKRSNRTRDSCNTSRTPTPEARDQPQLIAGAAATWTRYRQGSCRFPEQGQEPEPEPFGQDQGLRFWDCAGPAAPEHVQVKADGKGQLREGGSVRAA